MSWLFIKRPRFCAVVVWLTGLYCVRKWVNDLFCVWRWPIWMVIAEESEKKNGSFDALDWKFKHSSMLSFGELNPRENFSLLLRPSLADRRVSVSLLPVIRTQLSATFQTVNIGLVFSALENGKKINKIGLNWKTKWTDETKMYCD